MFYFFSTNFNDFKVDFIRHAYLFYRPHHRSLSRTVLIAEINKYVYMYKVKWSRYSPGVAQRVGRFIDLLFHDSGTRRGWVVSSTPRPHFTAWKTRYPFYRRLGGPQGRSGRAENLFPTGIWSRTVQPVVSNSTDWTTEATNICMYLCIYTSKHVLFLFLLHWQRKDASKWNKKLWIGCLCWFRVFHNRETWNSENTADIATVMLLLSPVREFYFC